MRLLVICLGFLMLPLTTLANPNTITIDNSTASKLIGKQVMFLEDESGKLRLEEILKAENQRKFKRHQEDVFARPASRSAIWFKITIRNDTGEDLWLEAGGNLACWYIDFFRPDSIGSYSDSVKTGSLRPTSSKEYPVNFYWLKLAKANDRDIKTYYLRITGQAPKEYPLKAGTLLALSKDKRTNDFLTAGFIGAMLIMTVYNMFLFFATRSRIYLIYICYLASTPLSSTFDSNYPLIENSTWLYDYFLVWHNIPEFFVGIFAVIYLKTKTLTPKFNRIYWGLIWIVGLGYPLLNLIGFEVVDLVNGYQVVLILYYILPLCVGIYLWIKGNSSARFYVLGWSSVVIGVIVIILVLNGELPFNVWTRAALYFGSTLEAMMFSFALADRLNELRREKEQSQIAHLKLIESQNEILEKKVAERTKEIHLQKEEILTQNEELLQNQEEISTQRDFIEKQNGLLTTKNQEITDSIRYAERIQQAILPTEEMIHNYFADHFLIYQPRDIVSGDFYWISEINNGLILVVADCTGHGVPGGFMSMIGYSLLNTIVNENKITDPAKILSLLHHGVYQSLRQKNGENNDGMDISICKIDQDSNENRLLTFASARQKLWYHYQNELHEIRGNKQSIGGSTAKKRNSFQNHQLPIQHGMSFFLTTDGYVVLRGPAFGHFTNSQNNMDKALC
ncbi:MAG: 7TM diverse intracellular signaling domain-containing protein [Flammeovirgaceae bacterium]